MELLSALGVEPGDCVAVVGAGGKTTLCWRLTQALAAQGGRVIFTTTTKIWQPADGTFDVLRVGPAARGVFALNTTQPWRTACLASAIEGTPDPTPVAEAGMPTIHTKLVGLAPDAICALKRSAQAAEVSIIVEADGARGLRIKAPSDSEPVIPGCADVVCVLANLDAIGLPLDERVAHRPERITHLTGAATGSAITSALITTLLSHPAGGMKGIPLGARRVAVLTQRSADKPHPAAERIIAALRIGGFDRAVVVAPRAPQPLLLCA